MSTDPKPKSISWRDQAKAPSKPAQPVQARVDRAKITSLLTVPQPLKPAFDDDALNLAHEILLVSQYVNRYVTQRISALDEMLNENTGDLPRQVDGCYMARKSAELLDDARKMLGRLEENLTARIGHSWVTMLSEEPIRGLTATGTPDIKDVPKIPGKTKDPEGYAAAMRACGIPDEAFDTGLVSFHFKGLGEYAARLAAEGRPLPAELKQFGTYPVYSLTLRGRSDSPLHD